MYGSLRGVAVGVTTAPDPKSFTREKPTTLTQSLGVFVWIDRFNPIQSNESKLILIFKTLISNQAISSSFSQYSIGFHFLNRNWLQKVGEVLLLYKNAQLQFTN